MLNVFKRPRGRPRKYPKVTENPDGTMSTIVGALPQNVSITHVTQEYNTTSSGISSTDTNPPPVPQYIPSMSKDKAYSISKVKGSMLYQINQYQINEDGTWQKFTLSEPNSSGVIMGELISILENKIESM